MAGFVLLLALSVSAISVASANYGEYDITPEEINPLCRMVDEFVNSKKPPAPQPVDPPVTGPNCHYFKWVSCDTPSPDPNRPCGWYEMKKCESARKKREHMSPEELAEVEEEERRAKRGVPEGPPRPGPVLLGFPNEISANDFDAFK